MPPLTDSRGYTSVEMLLFCIVWLDGSTIIRYSEILHGDSPITNSSYIMPIPLEIASKLIDEINGMVVGGMDIARLQLVREEADKLESANYVAAKRVKGMIAALNFDRKAVDQEFNAAVQASGGDLLVYINYAAALANIHAYVPAVEMIDAALEYAHGDAVVVREAMALHMDASDVSGAESLMNKLHSMDAICVDELNYLKGNLKMLNTALEDAGVSWQEVSERILFASNILINSGFAPLGRDIRIDEDGIFYRFALVGSSSDIAYATSKMLDGIADEPFAAPDRVISFSCEQLSCQ